MNFKKSIFGAVLIVFAIIGLNFASKLIFSVYWVPTGAMEPTLLGQKVNPVSKKMQRPGDRILVDRIHYDFKKLRRGDIIVFTFPDPYPSALPRDFVKRLIGLPGDKVQIASGSLIVNGKTIVEPYVKEPPLNDFNTIVPATGVFVLGDNRNNSADSRDWGFVPIENIKGVAFFIYYPSERSGFIPIFNF